MRLASFRFSILVSLVACFAVTQLSAGSAFGQDPGHGTRSDFARERSRQFIEDQRARSNQMIQESRRQTDQMLRDAEARHAQIRQGTYGQSNSRTTSNRSNSGSRGVRIRPRTIRGIIALVLIVGGGLWKLISSANQPPVATYSPPPTSANAHPNEFRELTPGQPPQSGSQPDPFALPPNPNQGDGSYLSGISDKIRKK